MMAAAASPGLLQRPRVIRMGPEVERLAGPLLRVLGEGCFQIRQTQVRVLEERQSVAPHVAVGAKVAVPVDRLRLAG